MKQPALYTIYIYICMLTTKRTLSPLRKKQLLIVFLAEISEMPANEKVGQFHK